MESIQNKYSRGKIYRLVCNKTGKVYYGSTIDTLIDRLAKHKCGRKISSSEVMES